MRAEQAAALTNFLLILLIAAGFMMAFWPDGTRVYSNPTKAVFQGAALAFLLLALVASPLAAVASWRTSIHAQRFLARETAGWQGLLEAGALGFALTLPFVLPGVVARQFNPGEWGQPQAFMLGLGYVGVYGLLGLVVGLALGCLLWLSAILGDFAFAIEWSAEPGETVRTPGTPPPPGQPPDLFGTAGRTAIREHLGLVLTTTQAPVDVLVIESVQQPSEN